MTELTGNPFFIKHIIDERNAAMNMVRTVETLNADAVELADDLRRELAGKDAEIAALKDIISALAELDFGANVTTDADERRMNDIARRARAAMAQAVQP